MNIPVDFLKTKDDLLNSMQEYWQANSNGESGNSANTPINPRSSSNVWGIENIAVQNQNNVYAARQ